jgi:hypothetical protein
MEIPNRVHFVIYTLLVGTLISFYHLNYTLSMRNKYLEDYTIGLRQTFSIFEIELNILKKNQMVQ